MSGVKSESQILVKIEEVERRLELIYGQIDAQLGLPFFERNAFLCSFLDVEKRVYELLLKELKWIINE